MKSHRRVLDWASSVSFAWVSSNIATALTAAAGLALVGSQLNRLGPLTGLSDWLLRGLVPMICVVALASFVASAALYLGIAREKRSLLPVGLGLATLSPIAITVGVLGAIAMIVGMATGPFGALDVAPWLAVASLCVGTPLALASGLGMAWANRTTHA